MGELITGRQSQKSPDGSIAITENLIPAGAILETGAFWPRSGRGSGGVPALDVVVELVAKDSGSDLQETVARLRVPTSTRRATRPQQCVGLLLENEEGRGWLITGAPPQEDKTSPGE